ncbi:MAG: hypothetical protein ACI9UO_002079 [Nitrospinales bacterium]|jgi:hypothetical protein
MITAAAVRFEGVVHTLPKPNRHHNIRHNLNIAKRSYGQDGFIDDRKGFVGRHEALCIALAYTQELRLNKQQTKPGEFCDPQHGLFSEDLW